MCELFAMSASELTDVNHSLALLRPRGGELGPHADGWGVAFYEGRAVRIFKEPIPAAESRCLDFITNYDFQSTTVIAHIRKANPQNVGRSSANTHPFERELNGRSWVFAHNGKLPGLHQAPEFAVQRFTPLGETDSEHAFCLLLDAIAAVGEHDRVRLSARLIVDTIRPLVTKMTELGEFNFLLSDGESLIAYAHTNLHVLQRNCPAECGQMKVSLLATSPLTGEPWVPLASGSFHVYSAGQEVALARKTMPSAHDWRGIAPGPNGPNGPAVPKGERQ